MSIILRIFASENINHLTMENAMVKAVKKRRNTVRQPRPTPRKIVKLTKYRELVADPFGLEE